MEKNINNEQRIKGLRDDFFVSLAPHIRSNDSVNKIMMDVIIAMFPILAGSIYFFGLNAVKLVIVCVGFCVASEYLFQKALKKDVRINDLSAVVTGMLIAFNLPATMPWWMAAFGSVFAMVVVKGCFGGIGSNFMNPALGARIVLMSSWAKEMTTYSDPVGFGSAVDAISSATPLQMIAAEDYASLPDLANMAIGRIPGVIGETSAILILIGAIYLVVRKVIRFDVPVIYVLTTGIILFVLGIPANIIPYELLGGGLLLGAVFMATDYSSAPITRKGKIIFAIGCGIITAVIRAKGSLPEGVSYAICLMNVVTPLIDRLTIGEAYGEASK
ncbi:MAG: RnfABCDGE type electron transport complex subunit D [Peptoniphilus sp.]|nr:RnfABCDGE type electron transport complex subunit D [Peptoniphilus sp.]